MATIPVRARRQEVREDRRRLQVGQDAFWRIEGGSRRKAQRIPGEASREQGGGRGKSGRVHVFRFPVQADVGDCSQVKMRESAFPQRGPLTEAKKLTG